MSRELEKLFKPIDASDNTFEKKNKEQNFAIPLNDDGAFETFDFGLYNSLGHSSTINLDQFFTDEGKLVQHYRTMSMHPECDHAIQEIVNEAIVVDEPEPAVSLNLDNIDELSESTKTKIIEEFDNILALMKFNTFGQDIFRRWYVDGKLFAQVVIDEGARKRGIRQIRFLDPMNIKKVRKIRQVKTKSGTTVVDGVDEFYVYNDKQLHQNTQLLEIPIAAVAYATSGIVQQADRNSTKLVLSHLHKAIRPLNHLKFLEDALIIYRISRAPERRIFYIDIGSMRGKKAEEYIKSIMRNFKNKVAYDPKTGEVQSDKAYNTMTEDYFLPRSEGSKGTEISSLPGGESIGAVEEITLFLKKLYKALNVPTARLESDQVFNMGRGSEITREEVKFHKFISGLRRKFSIMFNEILRRQLELKNIMNSDEWDEIEDRIQYDYAKDNHYAEMKDIDILRERAAIARDLGVDEIAGKIISLTTIMKKVFRMTDEEIEEEKKIMEKERQENPEMFSFMNDAMQAGQQLPFNGAPPGVPPVPQRQPPAEQAKLVPDQDEE